MGTSRHVKTTLRDAEDSKNLTVVLAFSPTLSDFEDRDLTWTHSIAKSSEPQNAKTQQSEDQRTDNLKYKIACVSCENGRIGSYIFEKIVSST